MDLVMDGLLVGSRHHRRSHHPEPRGLWPFGAAAFNSGRVFMTSGFAPFASEVEWKVRIPEGNPHFERHRCRQPPLWHGEDFALLGFELVVRKNALLPELDQVLQHSLPLLSGIETPRGGLPFSRSMSGPSYWKPKYATLRPSPNQ